ncbi:hypothetical protein [Streptomyces sp. NPDC057686]|uniref:hypothetical protein n=1 Tax=Streptomyces sp. NPDC057686 TaxID=3346212 RepID=UPI003689B432
MVTHSLPAPDTRDCDAPDGSIEPLLRNAARHTYRWRARHRRRMPAGTRTRAAPPAR